MTDTVINIENVWVSQGAEDFTEILEGYAEQIQELESERCALIEERDEALALADEQAKAIGGTQERYLVAQSDADHQWRRRQAAETRVKNLESDLAAYRSAEGPINKPFDENGEPRLYSVWQIKTDNGLPLSDYTPDHWMYVGGGRYVGSKKWLGREAISDITLFDSWIPKLRPHPDYYGTEGGK